MGNRLKCIFVTTNNKLDTFGALLQRWQFEAALDGLADAVSSLADATVRNRPTSHRPAGDNRRPNIWRWVGSISSQKKQIHGSGCNCAVRINPTRRVVSNVAVKIDIANNKAQQILAIEPACARAVVAGAVVVLADLAVPLAARELKPISLACRGSAAGMLTRTNPSYSWSVTSLSVTEMPRRRA